MLACAPSGGLQAYFAFDAGFFSLLKRISWQRVLVGALRAGYNA